MFLIASVLFALADSEGLRQRYGLRWDSVSRPTIKGAKAMVPVATFIQTNGWNMQTNALIFSYGTERLRTISGLPWTHLFDKSFPAVTHSNILYVVTDQWHHDVVGLAFNPKTNRFAPCISGFKHVGDHWYVWTQTETPMSLPTIYEGSSR